MKKGLFLIATLFTFSYSLAADIPENSICKKNTSGKLECIKINPSNLIVNGNHNNLDNDNSISVSKAENNIANNTIHPTTVLDDSNKKPETHTAIEPIKQTDKTIDTKKSDKPLSGVNDVNTNSSTQVANTVIYRYVDAQGGVHYTDNLPKDKKIKATIFKQN